MCFPHRLRSMGIIRLGLLILNEYRCKIVDILARSIHNIGRCIIGRQTIWRKRMLALNLNIMRLTCIFRCLASLTYYIQDWTTHSIETGRVNQVHHLPHAHHCFHHRCHFLLHGLHVGLHLFMYLFYLTHYSSFGTRLVWVL